MSTQIARYFAALFTVCSCLLAAEDPIQFPSLTITTNLNGTFTFSIDNRVLSALGDVTGVTGWNITSFHAEVTTPDTKIELPQGYTSPDPFTGDPALNANQSGYTLTFKNPIDTEAGATWTFLYQAGRDPRIASTTWKFDTSDSKLHDFSYILRWIEQPDGTLIKSPDGGNSVSLLGVAAVGLFAVHHLRRRQSRLLLR
jgi:hypothetical protein